MRTFQVEDAGVSQQLSGNVALRRTLLPIALAISSLEWYILVHHAYVRLDTLTSPITQFVFCSLVTRTINCHIKVSRSSQKNLPIECDQPRFRLDIFSMNSKKLFVCAARSNRNVWATQSMWVGSISG